jgi:hypothetical protein
MTTPCKHWVGSIANQPYNASEWETALEAFVNKVHDFNVRGQREEIPHPGWVQTFKFCPECGESLENIHKSLPVFGDLLRMKEIEEKQSGLSNSTHR